LVWGEGGRKGHLVARVRVRVRVRVVWGLAWESVGYGRTLHVSDEPDEVVAALAEPLPRLERLSRYADRPSAAAAAAALAAAVAALEAAARLAEVWLRSASPRGREPPQRATGSGTA